MGLLHRQPQALLDALIAMEQALCLGIELVGPAPEAGAVTGGLACGLVGLRGLYWDRYMRRLDDTIAARLGIPHQINPLEQEERAAESSSQASRRARRALTKATIAILKSGAVGIWDFYAGAVAGAVSPLTRERESAAEGAWAGVAECIESLAPGEWERWREAYSAVRQSIGGASSAGINGTTIRQAEEPPPGPGALARAVEAAAGGDWSAFAALAGQPG